MGALEQVRQGEVQLLEVGVGWGEATGLVGGGSWTHRPLVSW